MPVRIHITKKQKRKTVEAQEAVMATYDTEQKSFASRSERNKFYRGLHGYSQTVEKNGKVYRLTETACWIQSRMSS